MDFKQEVPDLQERMLESKKLRQAHPEKIPVIVEPLNRQSCDLKIIQNKFLIPKRYSFHEVLFHIRKRLEVSCTSSICLLVDNRRLPSLARVMEDIYQEHKDPDGFLYIRYSSEQIWG